MGKTWYLQRSQKPSCSWYGRPCRMSLSSSWRLLPWFHWASLSTTLLEIRAEENVSGTALVTSVILKCNSFTSTNTRPHLCLLPPLLLRTANGYNFALAYYITSSDIFAVTRSHLHVFIFTVFNWRDTLGLWPAARDQITQRGLECLCLNTLNMHTEVLWRLIKHCGVK